MHTLVLIRHGQSEANAGGLFTGLLDVGLTAAGRTEVASAAGLLNAAELWPSVWISSPLQRARQTATILQGRVRRPPERVMFDWRLAERNYGALTGRTKASVLAEHGEDRFVAWRRSVDVAPPPLDPRQRSLLGAAPDSLGLTESLQNVIDRVSSAWHHELAPALQTSDVLVIAQGNSLRALIAALDGLSDDEVRALNVPNAYPLVYRFGPDGRPMRRGGHYLDPPAARAAAERIAREGGT